MKVLDPIILPAQADPAPPAADQVSVFAKLISARPMLKALGPSGVGYALQPHVFQQTVLLITSNGGASVTTIGASSTATGTGSGSNSEALGAKTKYSSAASIGSTGSIGSNINTFRRGSIPNGSNGFFTAIRFALEDADYNNGRVFAGLTNITLASTVTQDDPGIHHFGIHHLPADGANWKITSEPGAGAATRSDSGVPFAVNHLYDLYLFCEPQGGTIYWRLDDLTAPTTTEGNRNANLPTGSNAMKLGVAVGTIDAVARSVSFARLYGESDR